MSAAPHSDVPIHSVDDLLAPFYEAETPRSDWMVGTEAEKFGVFRGTGKALPFTGKSGVQEILSTLVERHGWFETREYKGGDVIALHRGRSSITLEPGGQLELSGAPQETIHGTCAEFRGHMAELRDISDELGVMWLGLGFHPFARHDELPAVPKLRYAIMKKYLPTKGSMALDMMQRTCTVQANVDYSDEVDAMRKLRVGLRLQPIVTAMFANSPWKEDLPTGGRSYRANVWRHVDPDRSGLLPFTWESNLTYQRYIEWALDVPMFLVKRGATVLHNTGQTFRAFMKEGFEGAEATRTDWETHLNTLFPEVRIKNIIEVRGADGQDTQLVCALPALWKGILYQDNALSRAEALVESLTHQQLYDAQPDIAEHGLKANLQNRPVADWANEVLEIAWTGLTELSHLNRRGENETIHLERLARLVREGKCPADALLERVQGSNDFRGAVMENAEIDTRPHVSESP